MARRHEPDPIDRRIDQAIGLAATSCNRSLYSEQRPWDYEKHTWAPWPCLDEPTGECAAERPMFGCHLLDLRNLLEGIDDDE